MGGGSVRFFFPKHFGNRAVLQKRTEWCCSSERAVQQAFWEVSGKESGVRSFLHPEASVQLGESCSGSLCWSMQVGVGQRPAW